MAKTMSPQQIWEISERYTDQRFELVKIAFKELLIEGRAATATPSGASIGKRTVKLADDALAAMGQTPDTGLAADVLSEVEKPNLAIVREIRTRIQIDLDAELKIYANNPTTIVRVGGYRDGSSDARKHILAMFDAAMEKKLDAEMPVEQAQRPTRTEDGELLVDGE